METMRNLCDDIKVCVGGEGGGRGEGWMCGFGFNSTSLLTSGGSVA